MRISGAEPGEWFTVGDESAKLFVRTALITGIESKGGQDVVRRRDAETKQDA